MAIADAEFHELVAVGRIRAEVNVTARGLRAVCLKELRPLVFRLREDARLGRADKLWRVALRRAFRVRHQVLALRRLPGQERRAGQE